MATFSGEYAKGAEAQLVNVNGTVNLDGRILPRWTEVSVSALAEKPLAGTFIDNSPIPGYPAETLPGTRACSFFDDFYNRIYFFPGAVDFGAVTAETDQAVTIWNAFLGTTVLQGITVDESEGLDLFGPDTPISVGGLGTWNYSFRAYAEGPPAFNSTYTFTFDGAAGSYEFSVSGVRALLWPFKPNWASPYRVEYQYRTEILRSHSGKEQRVAMRQTPRKSLSHSVALLNRKQLREYERLMSSWQQRTWLFPERTRKAVSAAGMPAGGQSITVQNVPPWLQEGLLVVLESGDQQEIREIETITGETLAFSATGDAPWPSGTAIYPALSGHLAVSLQAPRQTNTVAELAVEFDALPGEALPDVVPAAAQTLRGREVFLARPNWAGTVNAGNEHPVSQVDFGRGRLARFYPVDFGTLTRQGTYLGRHSVQAEQILAFYLRCVGQQGEFYMPTWEQDMDLAEPVSPATTTMRISGTEVYENYNDDTVHRGVAVLLRTGEVVYRHIESMEVVSGLSGDDTAFQVGEPWVEAFGPEDVIMVSWMPAWRLASDGLTMEWLTDSVAQVRLSMRTVEDLPEEVV